MSYTGPLPPSAMPLMSPEHARNIALGLKWLAQSYVAAGMLFQATQAARDSEWWLGYSRTLEA